jgi:hypothetical protein
MAAHGDSAVGSVTVAPLAYRTNASSARARVSTKPGGSGARARCIHERDRAPVAIIEHQHGPDPLGLPEQSLHDGRRDPKMVERYAHVREGRDAEVMRQMEAARAA